MLNKKILLTITVITIILFSINQTSVFARTKQEAINDFFDSLKSELGYKNSKQENKPGVTPTSIVIQIAPYLNYKLPDTADLYYFFQMHQNPDYGFSEKENQTSNFNSTIYALYGLMALKTNLSIIKQWDALEYLNKTISNLVFYNKTEGNQTIIVQKENITTSELLSITNFIEITSIFDFKTKINITKLILQSLNYQYKNGSYETLYFAYSAIKCLSLFSMQPKDTFGAQKYLLSLRIGKSGFAKTPFSTPTLKETYMALEALKLIGYDLTKLSNKGDLIKYVLNQQQKTGGFKDDNEKIENILSTNYAIKILILLNSLQELQQKEFLVAEGFLPYNLGSVLIVIITGSIIKKRTKLNALN